MSNMQMWNLSDWPLRRDGVAADLLGARPGHLAHRGDGLVEFGRCLSHAAEDGSDRTTEAVTVEGQSSDTGHERLLVGDPFTGERVPSMRRQHRRRGEAERDVGD